MNHSKRTSKRVVKMGYEALERRDLLAGVSIEPVFGRATLLIDGTTSHDIAEVRDFSASHVEVEFNGDVSRIAKTDFVRIRFLGRSGNDTFVNQTDIDSAIVGHDGDDTLTGGNGNNWIRGGNGDDRINGGDRNDLIRAGAGNDFVYGGRRHDRIFGDVGNDELRGQQGNDFIAGDSGSDTLYGYTGNDRLFGDFGTDRLFGGDGDDYGNGGVGSDTINLGNGTDVAAFDQAFVEYNVGGVTGSLVVSGPGTDSVIAVEMLRFADGSQPAEPTEVQLNAGQQESLRLLNQLRLNRNQSQLSAAVDLNEFAQSWALDMTNNGFRHTTSSQRSHLVTVNRSSTTENIVFVGDTSLSAEEAASSFHQTWIRSSVHFANMTNSNNTDVGIGLALGRDGWYGVHVFGVS